ncbi:MAG: tRNA (guanosine(37)-N1)-methyltransferase TrmD [Defluviitaleaceae bacterium]|nr:tRNA (guanosine(37)-N1)-methyltransferase TrmD [Defluviitaleaceae bacterium]
MTFHVLTLFPEMIKQMVSHSILGRAVSSGFFSVNAVNIRDFSGNKHGQVDDAPYGGGAGMVMMAPPVYDAWASVAERKPRTIYLSPQGRTLTQSLAQELAHAPELILLCGHYEGIDERVIEEIVTDEISIGDYVLTGGEPAALVLIDAIARLLPGVLGKEASHQNESFGAELGGGLEYPHYTRPPEFRGRCVPEVLLSGHHGKIAEWRQRESAERTRLRRPDLVEQKSKD